MHKQCCKIQSYFYEEVSKQVKTGSKAAVMDVVSFLCVSLASTVQLHDSLGSRRACAYSEAAFSSQNGDRAWEVYYLRAAFCCAFIFCGQKGSMQKTFIKKCFLFTVGSVCRGKRFTTGWKTFRWWPRGWNGGAEVTEATVEGLLCYGFPRTGNAMGQVYQCLRRICR
jgi:hypothetical protein